MECSGLDCIVVPQRSFVPQSISGRCVCVLHAAISSSGGSVLKLKPTKTVVLETVPIAAPKLWF